MTHHLIGLSNFVISHLWGGSFLQRLFFAGLWGILATLVATNKHRSALAWGTVATLAGLGLEVAGCAVVVLVGALGKVDLRRKYLEMKVQDQIFQAMGGPSLIADDIEEHILVVLANNPKGLRLNALAQGVGESWRAIEATVEKLGRKKKIKKDGELYFLAED